MKSMIVSKIIYFVISFVKYTFKMDSFHTNYFYNKNFINLKKLGTRT